VSLLTTATLLAAETAPGEEGHPFKVPEVGLLFNYAPLIHFDAPGFLSFLAQKGGEYDGQIIITWPMLVLAGLTVLLGMFFWGAFRKFKTVPRGGQNVAEAGIDFVRGQIIQPILGNQGEKWLPMLVTLFFWIFILNLMGIIPGIQFPITSRMAIPALLAIFVWLVYNGVGIANQGAVGYFKNMMFPPGVPAPVYILLAPLEFVSTVIVRPFTLAVRLFANMVAGHMVLVVMSIAAATFWAAQTPIHKAVAVLPFAFGTVMVGFEIFVAGMQAFIFTVLTAVYIAGAQEAHH
jgi:F-type H+-transporting ATPase subunit a